jgi:hypothetical protein
LLLPLIIMNYMIFFNCFKRSTTWSVKRKSQRSNLVACVSWTFIIIFKIQWLSTWSQLFHRFKTLHHSTCNQVVAVSISCMLYFCSKHFSFSAFFYSIAKRKINLSVKHILGYIGNLPTHDQLGFCWLGIGRMVE